MTSIFIYIKLRFDSMRVHKHQRCKNKMENVAIFFPPPRHPEWISFPFSHCGCVSLLSTSLHMHLLTSLLHLNTP